MKAKTAFMALSIVIAALIAYNILTAPEKSQLKISTQPQEITPTTPKKPQSPPQLKTPSCLPQLTESLPSEKPIDSPKTTLKKNLQQYDGEFQEMLSDDMLSLVTNIGSNSARYERIRNRFYANATDTQKQAGQELLLQLRKTMNLPDQVQYESAFTKIDTNQVSYTSQTNFQKPYSYKETAQGDFDYQYITDGTFEITDYAIDLVDRSAGIVPRDLDKDIFLENFPCRIMMDTKMIATATKEFDTPTGKIQTQTLSTWLYDIDINSDDNLIHQATFYDRDTRKKPIVHIRDIKYEKYELPASTSGHAKKQYAFRPISYKMLFNDEAQDQGYTVNLKYTAPQEDQPDDFFNLTLDKPK